MLHLRSELTTEEQALRQINRNKSDVDDLKRKFAYLTRLVDFNESGWL